MENTLKEVKRIWRMRQEYFAVYGEYANRHKIELISANFRPKPKQFLIQNHLTEHDRMGKKTISRYCPFKELEVCNYSGLILLSGLVDDVSPHLGSPRSLGDKTSRRNRAGNAWYNRAGNAWFKRAGNLQGCRERKVQACREHVYSKLACKE